MTQIPWNWSLFLCVAGVAVWLYDTWSEPRAFRRFLYSGGVVASGALTLIVAPVIGDGLLLVLKWSAITLGVVVGSLVAVALVWMIIAEIWDLDGHRAGWSPWRGRRR